MTLIVIQYCSSRERDSQVVTEKLLVLNYVLVFGGMHSHPCADNVQLWVLHLIKKAKGSNSFLGGQACMHCWV